MESPLLLGEDELDLPDFKETDLEKLEMDLLDNTVMALERPPIHEEFPDPQENNKTDFKVRRALKEEKGIEFRKLGVDQSLKEERDFLGNQGERMNRVSISTKIVSREGKRPPWKY